MSPLGLDVRFAVVLFLAISLASCSRIAAPEPPAPSAPAPHVTPVVSDSPTFTPAPRRVPVVVVPASGTEPVEADVILASAAAADTSFQRQVAFWVDFWTGRQAELFATYLKRMGTYAPLVDEELATRGLPASLRYLPIVESGYFPRAVSRVGATGLWQLMGPTARDLGLAVGSIVDDRRDPFAATVAALDYLEMLHRDLGSWFLALAAYNVGPGRVREVLTRAGRRGAEPSDEDFLAIRGSLPAETREFVPRFFAAAKVAQDPVRFGFLPIQLLALDFDEVVVPDATSMDVVAQAAGVTEAEVIDLNPQYLRGFTPIGARRTVRLPVGTGAAFEVAYAMIPPEERLSYFEHVVARGETFSHIAVRYGVPLSELVETNRSVDPRRLQIGMRIVIPVRARGGAGGSSQLAALGTSANETLHVVTEGESLWTIARRYGISTDALARENQKQSNPLIRPGDELKIP
ncbi:MAG: LysM peptidoglycan-binding domain-containing protein [Gemmatimonadetes bacterium]|nr:LysM peptidoglycan-binding domain-containing protein [Gemmatimonadota bacterium]